MVFFFAFDIHCKSKVDPIINSFTKTIDQYNKWMFSDKYLHFSFPLFTTCMHMIVQFSLASIVLYLFPRFRPRSDSISNPSGHNHVRKDSTQAEKPLMTRLFYVTRIGPCGIATGLDIGLGNMSLKFITLTFYSMPYFYFAILQC